MGYYDKNFKKKKSNFFDKIPEEPIAFVNRDYSSTDFVTKRIETQSMSPCPGFDLYCPPLPIRKTFNISSDSPYDFYCIDNETLLQQQLDSIYKIPSQSMFSMGFIHGFSNMDMYDNIRMNRVPEAYYRTTKPELDIYNMQLKPLYKYNNHYYWNITKELSDHIIINANQQVQRGLVYDARYAYRFRYVFSPGENVNRPLIWEMLKALSYYYFKNFIIYANVLPGDIDTFMPTIHFIVSNIAYRQYKNSNMLLSRHLESKIKDINYGMDILKSGREIDPKYDIHW